MATVYLGRVLGAGGFQRLVAVKKMHPHIASDPEFVVMFLDEARLAAGIRHPNVVATLDIEQGSDGLFLVMEYVEGHSAHVLEKVMRHFGQRMPTPVLLRIVLDALAGLHAAHGLRGADGRPIGLVHRDVSPQNILVGVDGVSRITDFGVARAEARISSTRGSQVKGKVPYMSPEQLRAEELDSRSDVYAMGVVLWELLAGRRLFKAPSDGALVAMVLTGVTQPPSAVMADVPSELDAVCMQALSPAVDDRFSNAAEFADALERAAELSGVSIATPRAVGRFVTQTLEQAGLLPLPLPLAGAGEAPRLDELPPLGAASLPDSSSRSPARDVAAEPAPLPVHGSGATVAGAVSAMTSPRRAAGVGAAVGGAIGAVVLVLVVVVAIVGRRAELEPAAAPAAHPQEPAPTGLPQPEPAAAGLPLAASPSPEVVEAEPPEDAAAAPVAQPTPVPKSTAPRAPAAVRPPPAATPPAAPAAKPKPGGEYQPDRL